MVATEPAVRVLYDHIGRRGPKLPKNSTCNPISNNKIKTLSEEYQRHLNVDVCAIVESFVDPQKKIFDDKGNVRKKGVLEFYFP